MHFKNLYFVYYTDKIYQILYAWVRNFITHLAFLNNSFILFQGSNINSKVGTGIGLGLSTFAWNYGGFCSFSVQDPGRFARSRPPNGGKSHSNFQEFQFCGRVGHASLLTGKELLAISLNFWGADTVKIEISNTNKRPHLAPS